MTVVVKLTKAAARDLRLAHEQGGVALGLCYGPFKQLTDAGLAVQVTPPNAPNGYAVRLTAEGHELADSL